MPSFPRFHALGRRSTVRLAAVLVAAALAWLVPTAAPQIATAVQGGPPAVVLREVAVGAGGRLAARDGSRGIALPIRAEMVGASWAGPVAELEMRAKGVDGAWSRWVELHATPGEGPDPQSHEARATRGRHVLANPIWVGDATQVEVRVPAGAEDARGRAVAAASANASDVRLVAINASGTATARDRAMSGARDTAARMLGGGAEAEAVVSSPGIVSRAGWGARAAKSAPGISDGVRGFVLHHTVNSNSYSCSSVPSMLRGIQSYHMNSNGWDDMGYNFLVDRCGGVWEGRGGGVTEPVIGAHTYGFNTNTAGIALLGTHSASSVGSPARSAVVRLVAWRADVARINPTGSMVLTARADGKFQEGQRVTARAIAGHRDLFGTDCPGSLAYGIINSLRSSAWAYGGPKLTYPSMKAYVYGDGSIASVTVAAVSNASSGWIATWRRSSDGVVLATTMAPAAAVKGVVKWNGLSKYGARMDAADVTLTYESVRSGVRSRPWVSPITT